MLGKTIKNKMRVSVIVQVMIVTLLMGGVFSFASAKIVRGKTVNNAVLLTDLISSELENDINNIADIPQSIMKNTSIYGIMEKTDSDEAFSYADYFEVYGILRDMVFGKSYISSISVLLNRGERVSYLNAGVIRASDAMNGFVESGRAESGQKWYYDNSDGNVDYIFYKCDILHPYSLERLGSVIIQVDTGYFEAEMRKHTSDEYDIIIAAMGSGVIYSSAEDAADIWRAQIMGNIRADEPRTVYSDRGLGHMVIAGGVKSTGWQVTLVYPYRCIYRDTWLLLLCMAALCLVSVIIIMFIAHRLNVELVKPTYQLVDAMERVDSDGIAADIDYYAEDEFSFVFKKFNMMNSRIRALLDQNYKRQLSIRNMQLKALQSQINPHFLFNTLQSIQWMSELGGNKKVSRMVLALSKIMEYVLKKPTDCVLLREELDYTEKYIELIRARYEDSIVFTFDISDETLELEVPKLLIQPFVENCIYHAKISGAVLHILIKSEITDDGSFEIRIHDDGRGMSDAELERLRASMAEGECQNSPDRIGIVNVNTRIRLLYGSGCGVRIESREGSFTDIRLILNKIRRGGKNEV